MIMLRSVLLLAGLAQASADVAAAEEVLQQGRFAAVKLKEACTSLVEVAPEAGEAVAVACAASAGVGATCVFAYAFYEWRQRSQSDMHPQLHKLRGNLHDHIEAMDEEFQYMRTDMQNWLVLAQRGSTQDHLDLLSSAYSVLRSGNDFLKQDLDARRDIDQYRGIEATATQVDAAASSSPGTDVGTPQPKSSAAVARRLLPQVMAFLGSSVVSVCWAHSAAVFNAAGAAGSGGVLAASASFLQGCGDDNGDGDDDDLMQSAHTDLERIARHMERGLVMVKSLKLCVDVSSQATCSIGQIQQDAREIHEAFENLAREMDALDALNLAAIAPQATPAAPAALDLIVVAENAQNHVFWPSFASRAQGLEQSLGVCQQYNCSSTQMFHLSEQTAELLVTVARYGIKGSAASNHRQYHFVKEAEETEEESVTLIPYAQQLSALAEEAKTHAARADQEEKLWDWWFDSWGVYVAVALPPVFAGYYVSRRHATGGGFSEPLLQSRDEDAGSSKYGFCALPVFIFILSLAVQVFLYYKKDEVEGMVCGTECIHWAKFAKSASAFVFEMQSCQMRACSAAHMDELHNTEMKWLGNIANVTFMS